MPLPSQLIQKGKIILKDGKCYFKLRPFPKSAEIDIPIEEILEDYNNMGVEMTLCTRNFGEPLWAKFNRNWDTEIETKVDADYKHCSEAGRERFLDMKLGLMVHFGTYTHNGTLESWAAYADNAPMWYMNIYYTQ
jgi:hypothetical protein